VNKLLKSVLKTAVILIDQYSDEVARVSERVSDRVSALSDRGRQAIYPENHTLGRVLSFAAGVGLGIGAGVMLAPASGAETRDAINEKVHEIGAKVREQFTASASQATGTDAT
jgi:gas vesicle protein